jgi:hypothetical protein
MGLGPSVGLLGGGPAICVEEFRGLAAEPLLPDRCELEPGASKPWEKSGAERRMWATARRMASNGTYTSPALTFELTARCSVSEAQGSSCLVHLEEELLG